MDGLYDAFALVGFGGAMKVLVISDNPPRPHTLTLVCARKCHKWQALCKCKASRVCERCGIGQGTIPCESCMVNR